MKKLLKICLFLFVILAFYSIRQDIMDFVEMNHFSIRTASVERADTSVDDIGTGMYSYETLDEDEKLVYNQIIKGIKEWKKKITVSTNNEDKLKRAYQALMSEHSELFWVEGYQFTLYEVGGVKKDYVFEPIYIYTEEEANSRQEKIDSYLLQCQQGLPADADDYQKVKYVYEYLIKNTEYNVNANENQNICSVFIQKESVCKGYALSMQYLLQRFGIPCVVVSGTADGESHAWNLVKMDGEFYYVDATWGEVNISQEDMKTKDIVNYSYLGVTTEELFESHKPDNSITLPVCSAIADNYYVREGRYLTEFNINSVDSMVEQDYQRDNVVSIKCANSAVYEELYLYLIEEANACKIMKVNGISYIEDNINNILTIYPQEMKGN